MFVLEPKEGGDKFTSGQISAGAEDDHDEGWQNAIGLCGGAAGCFLAGGHQSGGGGDFAMNAFDMDAGTMKGFVDHAVVTVFVVGGDPPFVSEVEAGGGPGPFELGEALVKGFGGGAS